jgi:hypothetical protein
VSDVEHELLVDGRELRDEIARPRSIARRAIRAAAKAQDRVDGRHESWLDDALTELSGPH